MPDNRNHVLDALLSLPDGEELGTSEWYRVTQQEVDDFARLTHDEDRHHNDPDWARENSSIGKTISFGFFTLSLLSYFAQQVFEARGISSDAATQMLNFGFDRLRMPEAVPVGSEIRGRFTYAGSRQRPRGGLEISVTAIVEIKSNARPALVADWLFVAVPDAESSRID